MIRIKILILLVALGMLAWPAQAQIAVLGKNPNDTVLLKFLQQNNNAATLTQGLTTGSNAAGFAAGVSNALAESGFPIGGGGGGGVGITNTTPDTLALVTNTVGTNSVVGIGTKPSVVTNNAPGVTLNSTFTVQDSGVSGGTNIFNMLSDDYSSSASINFTNFGNGLPLDGYLGDFDGNIILSGENEVVITNDGEQIIMPYSISGAGVEIGGTNFFGVNGPQTIFDQQILIGTNTDLVSQGYFENFQPGYGVGSAMLEIFNPNDNGTGRDFVPDWGNANIASIALLNDVMNGTGRRYYTLLSGHYVETSGYMGLTGDPIASANTGTNGTIGMLHIGVDSPPAINVADQFYQDPSTTLYVGTTNSTYPAGIQTYYQGADGHLVIINPPWQSLTNYQDYWAGSGSIVTNPSPMVQLVEQDNNGNFAYGLDVSNGVFKIGYTGNKSPKIITPAYEESTQLAATNLMTLDTNGNLTAVKVSGNGSGLTSLNAGNLTGTQASGTESANTVLLTGTQTISGSKTFSAGVAITGSGSASPILTLSSTGGSAPSATLQATSGGLAIGTVSTVLANGYAATGSYGIQIPSNGGGITNASQQPFSGNGSGLTNLSAASIASGQLATNYMQTAFADWYLHMTGGAPSVYLDTGSVNSCITIPGAGIGIFPNSQDFFGWIVITNGTAAVTTNTYGYVVYTNVFSHPVSNTNYSVIFNTFGVTGIGSLAVTSPRLGQQLYATNCTTTGYTVCTAATGSSSSASTVLPISYTVTGL